MNTLDLVYQDYLDWSHQFRKDREAAPIVRIWDGNWVLFSEIHGLFELEFEFVRNDVGTAYVDLPLDHFVSEWVLDPDARDTKDLHLTFDKDGARWSGKVSTSRVVWNSKGKRSLRITARHDFQHLKNILVWPNPFLPAEIQIPKAWNLFGPADWAMATTLHVNLLRKFASLWMLPDDPMDFGQWGNLDMSNWNIAIKPVDFFASTAPPATITSRYKDFHTAVKDVANDSQLSIECRRYLPGDPDPIPGKTLKYGCLVFEIVDKSGWNTETSFGGNLFAGLQRAWIQIAPDGMTEGVNYIDHPDFPDEYYQPGFKGTMPEAPWVVLEDGPYTGIESSEYEYTPPGPVQFVTGGQSMPGVNEGMKAMMIGLGGLLGSIFNQSQMGSVFEAIVEPLYTDTLMAFQAHKMNDRIAELGDDPLFEYWVDGSDRAYTLSALIAMRKAKFATREKHTATVKMNDAAPYAIGQFGQGDLFIGDRVAVHAAGMPRSILFVEQVEKLTYSLSGSGQGWEIEIGQPTVKDALLSLFEKWEETSSGLRELGVL